MTPTIRVVGLGPGDPGSLTERTRSLLETAPIARLRTRRHPNADQFANVPSYDEWYERATSFDELYGDIVDDLVSLAQREPGTEVLYVVPGSPVVAERTVELLRAREDVTTYVEPAVSVIDVACSRLARDPMGEGLRVIDALGPRERFRGPGPLLVLQAHSPELLASVAEWVAPGARVIVLHHLGLDDEHVQEMTTHRLGTFAQADHLTSLWIEPVRDAGVATGDLLEVVKRLRAECAWDQEQTHESLRRHLLEEAYEAIDALESYSRSANEPALAPAGRHVEEELGDLLFQIVFHAELGDEEGAFSFTTIVDALHAKLVARHPHVFGDVTVSDSNDVAARWEELKRQEKGRSSVTDGVLWQLPSLTLYTKLLRTAQLVGANQLRGDHERQRAMSSLAALKFAHEPAPDSSSTSDVDAAWGEAICGVVGAALYAGVDLESVLRERATRLVDEIKAFEARS